DAVRSDHLRVESRPPRRDRLAREDAIAIDPVAGDAIETLGDVDPSNLDARAASRLRVEAAAAKSETIGRKLVAVAADVEEHRLAEETGLIERDDALRVGDVADASRRLELDERHAAARRRIDDFDDERAARIRVSVRLAGDRRGAPRDGKRGAGERANDGRDNGARSY